MYVLFNEKFHLFSTLKNYFDSTGADEGKGFHEQETFLARKKTEKSRITIFFDTKQQAG